MAITIKDLAPMLRYLTLMFFTFMFALVPAALINAPKIDGNKHKLSYEKGCEQCCEPYWNGDYCRNRDHGSGKATDECLGFFDDNYRSYLRGMEIDDYFGGGLVKQTEYNICWYFCAKGAEVCYARPRFVDPKQGEIVLKNGHQVSKFYRLTLYEFGFVLKYTGAPEDEFKDVLSFSFEVYSW